MPELPEVEAIRRSLLSTAADKQVVSANVLDESLLQNVSCEQLSRRICAASIGSLSRRGKYMLFGLTDYTLIIHLGMTGLLLRLPKAFPEEKYTRAEILLSDEYKLRFIDPRRFGKLWLVKTEDLGGFARLSSLGVEPFDEAVSGSYLSEKLSKSTRSIKACLLDQRVIAGIGNIYSDELCFSARLNPAACAASLSESQWAELARIIPERMQFFVEKNLVSADEFARERRWHNSPYFQVYGRSGQACVRCGTILVRRILAARGSVYCPNCQK